MTVDDPGTNPPSFPGAEARAPTVTVDPGAYNGHRDRPVRLRRQLLGRLPGSIAIGQTKTCTVTNDDIAAAADRDQARDQRQRRHGRRRGDFTLTVDDPGTNPADRSRAPRRRARRSRSTPGTYEVTETGPSGYAASVLAPTAPARSPSARPRPARSPTTTSRPQLTVIKHVINDNGGTAAAVGVHDDRRRSGTNPPSFAGRRGAGHARVTVDPGAYRVTETGPSGYTASYSADCSGSIAIGQTKTCTVTNNDIAAAADRDQARHQRQRRHRRRRDFTLTVDDPGTNPASFPGAESPGTTVTRQRRAPTRSRETGPSGYAASVLALTAPARSPSARPRPARSPTTTSRRS